MGYRASNALSGQRGAEGEVKSTRSASGYTGQRSGFVDVLTAAVMRVIINIIGIIITVYPADINSLSWVALHGCSKLQVNRERV